MAEFFADYGLFLLKTLTFVVAFAAVVIIGVAASKRGKTDGQLDVTFLNDRYQHLEKSLKHSMLPKKQLKQMLKHDKQKNKKDKTESDAQPSRKRLFVIDFRGDIKASEVASLREEITAILMIARSEDEVLLRLENAGGLVHEHGLAASQLQRLKERKIPLTIAVDKVAASGGYLMACIADHIIAAPFAILGSIGVLAQIPNFHRLLEQHGIDFEQIKAGDLKRTLTMFGKNSPADRARMQEQVEDIHTLFKNFVAEHRPVLDINQVATGEHWHGLRALQNKLIDALETSDDYLLNAKEHADLYEISYKIKKDIGEKIAAVMQSAIETSISKLLQQSAFWRH